MAAPERVVAFPRAAVYRPDGGTQDAFTVVMPRLMSVREAAAYCGISLSTAKAMCRRHELPVCRFGRSVRVDAQALADQIHAASRGAGP